MKTLDVKAVLFDCFGVLVSGGEPDHQLFDFIQRQLKPRYKIGLISNMNRDIVTELIGVEYRRLFDAETLSCKVLHAKPDPAIYCIAAGTIGVELRNCVFVDDLAANCEAARSVGMRAIEYSSFDSFRQSCLEYGIISA